MHEPVFADTGYTIKYVNQVEWNRLARCWHGLINFICRIWLKEEPSHQHAGRSGRIDPLTLGGSCWLWFSSSRQCCSLRRQERYSSLRLSNSECSSLHWRGEHHQRHHHQFLLGQSPRSGTERAPCESPPHSFGIFTTILPSQLFSEISVWVLTVSPSFSGMCLFK